MKFLVAGAVVTSTNARAFVVDLPQNNIVQNGTFAPWNFDHWNGLIAIAGSPPAPNGMVALGSDIYQDLATIPNQRYMLDFFAAADLLFGPTVTLNVAVSGQSILSFSTPPYAYDPQTHRYDQMHWAEYSVPFTASSSSTRLEFMDMNTPYFGLSAVSVVPVPEPSFGVLLLLMATAGVVCCRRSRCDDRCRSATVTTTANCLNGSTDLRSGNP
jgi:hypothetical protein